MVNLGGLGRVLLDANLAGEAGPVAPRQRCIVPFVVDTGYALRESLTRRQCALGL